MAPIVPDPRRIRAFSGTAAFDSWLARNHDRAPEIWVRIYKKHTGIRSIDAGQAVEVALCWGWIDGIRKTYDEQSFLQRFTPRRAKSRWSLINTRRVAQLIRAGRMTPHGLKHVHAAKRDGRWQAAYAPPSEIEVPPDLLAAIRAVPAAARTFRTLNRRNRVALAYLACAPKTAAGRARKIATLVAMLARGEVPWPAGASA